MSSRVAFVALVVLALSAAHAQEPPVSDERQVVVFASNRANALTIMPCVAYVGSSVTIVFGAHHVAGAPVQVDYVVVVPGEDEFDRAYEGQTMINDGGATADGVVLIGSCTVKISQRLELDSVGAVTPRIKIDQFEATVDAGRVFVRTSTELRRVAAELPVDLPEELTRETAEELGAALLKALRPQLDALGVP